MSHPRQEMRPTPVARQRRLPSQIEEGGCRYHVVEDGADSGGVRHHDHAQQVKKDHVAMAVVGGVGQLL